MLGKTKTGVKKNKSTANMIGKVITLTQPTAWVDAWKRHMALTGRSNLSDFIAQGVNELIAKECESLGRKNPIQGERGSKGKRPS
jgi:hypothetical protein